MSAFKEIAALWSLHAFQNPEEIKKVMEKMDYKRATRTAPKDLEGRNAEMVVV